jgi:diguanylate cyclase (GGDEF)-like protein
MFALRYINQAAYNEALLREERENNARQTRRLEELTAELSMLHNHDMVTKLYNRQYFSACVDKAIRRLTHNEIVAMIQFDVDRFKTINGNYGHACGDKVIAEIAGRLREWNHYDAVLSRLGGDEFTVMLQGPYSRYDIGEFCKQIISLCNQPIFVDTQVLYITVSAGISLCPYDAGDSETLLKNSDISMHKAKAEGYNKYVFYNTAFQENIHRNNEIEALLRKADPDQDFELAFQPQFDLPGRRLLGAEALIRWKSAEHGYIPPSVFIPVAEEINFIGQIGAWVLKKAVEQIISWNTGYGLELKMGVNISPKQLSERSFFATMKTLIGESGVNPAWLDAEITENLMIEEKTKVKPIFTLFEELGISVSIDDFGSGYSSLGYLNKFHFDRIKIDKSLVDNLLAPGGSGIEIVRAIVNMADAVGKLTIAEGVEKPEQLKILEELGCRQVQGYLFGRPVSAAEFTEKYIKDELQDLPV